MSTWNVGVGLSVFIMVSIVIYEKSKSNHVVYSTSLNPFLGGYSSLVVNYY